MLDMEVQVAEDNSVDYRFYSHFVMRKSLAMPARTKMNGITQEVIRRLRNTWATLGWENHQAPSSQRNIELTITIWP